MAARKVARSPLGKELAKLRIDSDQQLKEMAKALDVNQATLRNYENGKSAPDRDFFAKVKDIYDADLTRFYEERPLGRPRRKDMLDLSKLDAATRKAIEAVIATRNIPQSENEPQPAAAPSGEAVLSLPARTDP